MKDLCKKIIPFTFVLCMALSVFTGVVYAKGDDTIVILSENDEHCAAEGYSKLAAMKNELMANYTHLGVVSAGRLNRAYNISKLEHPLSAFEKLDQFKLFVFDKDGYITNMPL